MGKPIQFVCSCSYDKLEAHIYEHHARRVGNFLEAMHKGKPTFKIDFNLGKGYYRGWTIEEMAETDEGSRTLGWVLMHDFPEEVKKHISKVLGI